MKEKRIILMGTPEFSAIPFKAIIDAGYNVVGLVSQPDRPQGRKKEIIATPTKKMAVANNIEVFQPEKIKLDYKRIEELKPDLIITCAYGQIIPQAVLDIPTIGCINIHASLLPEYRGGAPIHKAIIDGKKETGITIMDMELKMDAGDIIFQDKVAITKDMTTSELFDVMADLGAKTMLETIDSILDGTATRTKQDESKVTYAWNISKEEELITWDRPAQEVYDHIRGLISWPVGHSKIDLERFKFHKARLTDMKSNKAPGTMEVIESKLVVNTNDLMIELLVVQPAGKPRIEAKEYINSYANEIKFN